jgi:hypothetical protein
MPDQIRNSVMFWRDAARNLAASNPDDLRAAGWMVACHNDYRLAGERFTFWLFTRGAVAVKGEGRTDAEALNQVREKVRELEETLNTITWR